MPTLAWLWGRATGFGGDVSWRTAGGSNATSGTSDLGATSISGLVTGRAVATSAGFVSIAALALGTEGTAGTAKGMSGTSGRGAWSIVGRITMAALLSTSFTASFGGTRRASRSGLATGFGGGVTCRTAGGSKATSGSSGLGAISISGLVTGRTATGLVGLVSTAALASGTEGT
ncbi:MAG TPA: hypothetical protein VJS40_02265, partial [Aestuariivirgaceae bacterium]|nr:hypothetical protein [Aestuariivirgaceae bacterium]